MGITTTVPLEAAFRQGVGGGREYTETLPVVAVTDDDGHPIAWVLSKRRLERATSFSNFVGIDVAEPTFSVVVPAEPGWFRVGRNDVGERAWWIPILAWGITTDGYTVSPIIAPQSSDTFGLDEIEDDDKECVWFDAGRDRNGGWGDWPEHPDDEETAETTTT